MTIEFNNIIISTESDVEQKFIYPLFTTPLPLGLGYSDEDIQTKINIRKLKIDKGNSQKIYYPDYVIIIEGLPVAIIEAKAPGELGDAFREARLYASEINASYPSDINPCETVIVTDGVELHIGNWDISEPTTKILRKEINPTTQIYVSIQSSISKNSLIEKCKKILKRVRKSSRYFKPKHMLGGNTVINETVGENSFGSNISVEYRHLFNPVTTKQRTEIVQNAYVTSKRKMSHVAPIEKIVRASIPTFEKVSTKINDTKKPIEIIEKLAKHQKLKHEVCLLIGSVGSGKSTFTDYLRVLALPKDMKESIEWVNINLNEAPLQRDMIYKWVSEKTVEKIIQNNEDTDFDEIDNLYKIYDRQIEKLKKGRASLFKDNQEKYNEIIFQELTSLQKDSSITLSSFIHYLEKYQRKSTIIILDNCDKGNSDDQLLMFEVANWLKKEFECIVFLPLRDSTYDRFKDQPPLDTVIKDLVFRIDPPLLDKVIYSRLNYLSKEISDRSDDFYYFLGNGTRVKCKYKEVDVYIRSVITTLFQDKFFRRIIIGIAGRNIRKGLEMVLDFCKSGHINEEEILKIRQSQGETKIPQHLISKILLKGNKKYYSDKDSHIQNLFSSYDSDELPDPFIRISILELLSQKFREYGPNRTKGFHKVSEILKTLQMLGHSYTRSYEEISTLAESGCINSESHNRDIQKEDLVCISASGFIHLELLKNINYLSVVSEDTLFRENKPASEIRDNIIGAGTFKSDSKQTAILNAKILTEYLYKYNEEYSLGTSRTVEQSFTYSVNKIPEIFEYVSKIASSDESLNSFERLNSIYPKGSHVEAQIVSIQKYGIFVEFGIDGTGMIHKSDISQPSLINTLEVGDWINAEIVSYNTEHNRFKLTLA
ncbi:type I restriction endonuclease [Rheinheimera sp.]|uniref:type I restriction endonuclease n=1 Tax=Rheinheimera sp. TaxID=1869214 RepID=UPI0027B9850D|nr:type I restriction endonuclease [Rheinheimera sp.]